MDELEVSQTEEESEGLKVNLLSQIVPDYDLESLASE